MVLEAQRRYDSNDRRSRLGRLETKTEDLANVTVPITLMFANETLPVYKQVTHSRLVQRTGIIRSHAILGGLHHHYVRV